jgi:hypothetical protein
MTDALACPSTEDLQRFLLGHMPDAEAERLERHLAQCRLCVTAVQGLTASDALVEAVRAASRKAGGIETGADEALITLLCRPLSRPNKRPRGRPSPSGNPRSSDFAKERQRQQATLPELPVPL